VTKKADIAKLAQTKTALAEKCDRLIKVTKSRPRQENLKKHAERFRRQAAQCQRQVEQLSSK
jgi:hypothetical protein